MNEQEYAELIRSLTPRSPIGKDCLNAFLVGGGICVLGQLLGNLYQFWGASAEAAGAWTSVTLIALSALLTGLSLYDDIARFAGAGTLVPITGFANAVSAPAVEFQTEGMVLGVAAKMFTIAGPVIVYGISASIIYGFLFFLSQC